MIKMQSPTPNRNGVYEIHDVPSRRVDAMRAQGWIEVKPAKKPDPEPEAKSKPGPKPGYKRRSKAAK